MIKKIAAIAFIYLMTVFAWIILGATVQFRTYDMDAKLKRVVGQLWGDVQRQEAPRTYYKTKETSTQTVPHRVPLEASKIKVGLDLGYRRKGLLWYSTYRVNFSGKYKIVNPTAETREMFFEFPLPNPSAVYDNPRFAVSGKEISNIDINNEGNLATAVNLKAGQSEDIEVSYSSQGMDEWWYRFGDEVSQVKDFSLIMDTDFTKIDFPENSISPTEKNQTARG